MLGQRWEIWTVIPSLPLSWVRRWPSWALLCLSVSRVPKKQ